MVVILTFSSCTKSDSTEKTISLTLIQNGPKLQVSDYEVLNRPYKKSSFGQQGSYRIHLLDKTNSVIQKVGFGSLNIQSTRGGSSTVKVYLPLKPDLYQIVVYKLDGSSGHYRLDSDHPLLSWTLPDSLRNHQNSD